MRIKAMPRHLTQQNVNVIIAATSAGHVTRSSVKKLESSQTGDGTENLYISEIEQVNMSQNGSSTASSSKFDADSELNLKLTRITNTKEENNSSEAVDLSNVKAEPDDDKFKDTFLYKIMTDPTFLETIQKNKQAKKPTCPFCKQEFTSDDQLDDHMDIKKDGSNQVVCCACGKTFAQKRYLRYHQRCHSDRNKFTCVICTRKYTRLDNLTRHNAFHVNPDKFACNFCEKTFARKDLLNKHQKCHENKFRFYCETCVKYFKGPLTLDNHKRTVHPNSVVVQSVETTEIAN